MSTSSVPKRIVLPSGLTASASIIPVAEAYGAGDQMATAVEFAFVDRDGVAVPTGSIIRILSAKTKIEVASVPAGQTSYMLHLFTVTPPDPQANNAVWALAATQLASYVGAINLGAPVDLGASLFVNAQYVDFDVSLTGTSLWGVLVTVGAHTATAVARQIRLLAVVL